uniref:Uncharacterized protein n=1 Tax=Rangifer tarandus platyrhynchus TaxID=3082113 RepID=A0ACB0F2A9_RANTA|nr:unnamed protein product [Rangifer tarandus platyrhynchus]
MEGNPGRPVAKGCSRDGRLPRARVCLGTYNKVPEIGQLEPQECALALEAYLKVSRGRAGNHNCQPPQLGTGRLPGGQRPGLVRGQDTSAVGEGGAWEVMWATGLGENAWAAMGEVKEPQDRQVLVRRRKWKTSNPLSGRRAERMAECRQGGFRPGRRAPEQMV